METMSWWVSKHRDMCCNILHATSTTSATNVSSSPSSSSYATTKNGQDAPQTTVTTKTIRSPSLLHPSSSIYPPSTMTTQQQEGSASRFEFETLRAHTPAENEHWFEKYIHLSVYGCWMIIKYCIFVPLGLVTFGMFWTEDIRLYIFSNYSNVREENDDEDDDDDDDEEEEENNEDMNKSLQLLASKIENLERNMSKQQETASVVERNRGTSIQVHRERQEYEMSPFRNDDETTIDDLKNEITMMRTKQTEEINEMKEQLSETLRLLQQTLQKVTVYNG